MRILIQESPLDDTVSMYVVDESNNVRRNIYPDGDLFVSEVIEEGSAKMLKPFLKCNYPMFVEITKGIVEFANKNHIQTMDKDYTRGKLEATESHLADMRKYLDKAMKIETNNK